MKTTRVVWVRPALESDNITDGRVRSLWGVMIGEVLLGARFTNKRAATLWAKSLEAAL